MILCTWAGFADNATESATCASWVQAWGSVLAIMAAVVVAYVQHRQNLKAQQRAAEDADARALAAPLAIAEQLARELGSIYETVRPDTIDRSNALLTANLLQAGVELERSRSDLEAFNGIVVQSLPTFNAIQAVRRLSSRFDHVITLLTPLHFTALNRITKGNISLEKASPRVSVLLNEINHELDLLRQELPPRAREASARHGR